MFGKLAFVLTLFALLLTVSAIAYRLSPLETRGRWPKAGFRLDALYWIATPTVTAWFSRAVVAALLTVAALILFGPGGHPWQGFGPAAALPLWASAIAALVCADFANYWVHRLMHQTLLWPIHAIHHSSLEVDWHSALRIHPLDRAIMQIGVIGFLLAVGFPLGALATVASVAGVIGVLVHLDTDKDLGWLRYAIATPVFHRWHHADEAAARDKNFAGIFPVWDLLFGTFYMPRDSRPTRFGAGEPIPQTYWAQLAYPMSRIFARQRVSIISPRAPGLSRSAR